MVFFRLVFLFMVGSVGGWVLELFFRRFFSIKKWINPGFLNGPYLPMYGFGTVLLYGACFVPLPAGWLVVCLMAALTLLEYITGLIFIKGMKIKLWDYSDRFGNIQGIICPLFTLLWGAVAAVFVFLLFRPLSAAAEWASQSVWMFFATGMFYGIFFVDLCISFNVSIKIRKAAAQFREAVHYERLKVYLNDLRAQKRQKGRFLFPFAGASFAEAVRGLRERTRLRYASLARRRKDKKSSRSDGEGKK